MKRKIVTWMMVVAMMTTVIVPASAASPNCVQTNCRNVWQFLCDWWQTQPGTGQNCPQKPEQPEIPEQPEVPEQPEENDSVEMQVVELVNEYRTSYGLQPLTYSAELSDGARLKSQDMSDNGYFDHNSPTYGTPYQMMKSLGISYQSAGENIAKGYRTAEAVVTAWMNSEGHRANILNANYTEIGVGYEADGNYWTQWFRSV